MQTASTSAPTAPRPTSPLSDSQPSTATKTPASPPHETAAREIGAQATTAEQLAARDIGSLSGPTAGERLAGQATTADRLAGRAAPGGEASAAAPTTTAAHTPPPAPLSAKTAGPAAPPSLDEQIAQAQEADKAVENARNAALDPKIQAAVVADLQAKADKLWGDVYKTAAKDAAKDNQDVAKAKTLVRDLTPVGGYALQAAQQQLHAAEAKRDADIQKIFDARLANTPPSQRIAVIDATTAGLKGAAPGNAAYASAVDKVTLDNLVALSPTLKADLAKLQADGWTISYGTAGGGTFADRTKKTITIDSNELGHGAQLLQSLSHEVGHAQYAYKADTSSKGAYVKGALADEGAATIENIRVQREILAAGGPDIGIAGDPKNHKAYNDAYDQFLKDGDAGKARDAIGSVYGKGEHTSTTGQSYEDYYGSWYDKNFPPKK